MTVSLEGACFGFLVAYCEKKKSVRHSLFGLWSVVIYRFGVSIVRSISILSRNVFAGSFSP